MAATTVRINQATHEMLRILSTQRRIAMVDVLDEAIENLHHQHVLEQTNAGYAALRADPEAWRELEKERAAWDATLSDGLAPE